MRLAIISLLVAAVGAIYASGVRLEVTVDEPSRPALFVQPAMQSPMTEAPRFGGNEMDDTPRATTPPRAAPPLTAPPLSTSPLAPPRTITTPLPAPVVEFSVRDAAVESLGRIGAAAVPSLILALDDRDAGVRLRAAQALSRIGPAAATAVAPLIEALDDADQRVRWQAARALGQIGPAASSAIPALVQQMKDKPR